MLLVISAVTGDGLNRLIQATGEELDRLSATGSDDPE